MPVYPTYTPGLGASLLGGVNAFLAARERKQDRQRGEQLFTQQMEAAARQRAIQDADLASKGIYLGTPGGPAIAPVIARQQATDALSTLQAPSLPAQAAAPGGMPGVQLTRAAAGRPLIPGAPGGASSFQDAITRLTGLGPVDRGPQYTALPNGGYIDHAVQWRAEDAQRRAGFEDTYARALLAQRVGGNDPLVTVLAPDGRRVYATRGAAIGQEAPGPNPVGANFTFPVGVDAAGRPAIFRGNTRTGDLSPTGVGANAAVAGVKVATDAERLAAGFADRMRAASTILSAIEADPASRRMLTGARSPSGSGSIPLVGNWTLSDTGQRYKQAQENWVRANLRKESGAAIGKDEMAQEVANYFPQPGDTDDLITQKARNRALAEQNMVRNAGTAATPVSQAAGGDVNPWRTP